jgi:Fructose-2,6-bisphosphatase
MLGLVRHGQTDWNARGILQGQTDIPLNEEGMAQAKLLAGRLQREEAIWDAVVTSDLKRAFMTGKLIADALGIPLLPPDARLRERSFGEAEGTTEEERLRRWGPGWRELELGVESDSAIRRRGREAVEQLTEADRHRRLLVVSHGSFIAQLLQELCSGLTDSRLGNLSYSVLERRDSSWHPLLHNCTKHLDNGPPAQIDR